MNCAAMCASSCHICQETFGSCPVLLYLWLFSYALYGMLPQVRSDLEAQDTSLFYSCFRHLAARPDAELRRTCAAQLPALMKSCLPGEWLVMTVHDVAMHDMEV